MKIARRFNGGELARKFIVPAAGVPGKPGFGLLGWWRGRLNLVGT